METFAEFYERKGREASRKETVCRMLLRALQRRFGDLSPAVEQRVQAADAALLEQWFDRCLDARGLDEVFV